MGIVARVELLLDATPDDAADGVNELLRELQRSFTETSCLLDYRIESFRATTSAAEKALASGVYEEGLAFAGVPTHMEPLAAVSTAHLSEVAREWVQAGMFGAVGYPNEYGAFLYAGDGSAAVEHEGVPDEVKAVLRWAAEHGIVWVKFDPDGPTVGDLAVFE